MNEIHFTYILFSPSKNRFYTGSTQNIQDRLNRHNSGYETSTKAGSPWELVYVKEFKTRSEAVKLEKKIKKRGAKRFLEQG